MSNQKRIEELERQLQQTQDELAQLRANKEVTQMSSDEFLAHRLSVVSQAASRLASWRPTGPAVDASKLSPAEWATYLTKLENKDPSVGPVENVALLSSKAFLEYRQILNLGGPL